MNDSIRTALEESIEELLAHLKQNDSSEELLDEVALLLTPLIELLLSRSTGEDRLINQSPSLHDVFSETARTPHRGLAILGHAEEATNELLDGLRSGIFPVKHHQRIVDRIIMLLIEELQRLPKEKRPTMPWGLLLDSKIQRLLPEGFEIRRLGNRDEEAIELVQAIDQFRKTHAEIYLSWEDTSVAKTISPKLFEVARKAVNLAPLPVEIEDDARAWWDACLALANHRNDSDNQKLTKNRRDALRASVKSIVKQGDT